LESINPLPEIDTEFIAADTLQKKLDDALTQGCVDSHGNPIVTILDFRNENHLRPDNPPLRIRSNCHTQILRLDDLQDPAVRAAIPRTGLVVTITETGNRDAYVTRYLSQFGLTNIKGLQFGMRGWIKLDYPTENSSVAD